MGPLNLRIWSAVCLTPAVATPPWRLHARRLRTRARIPDSTLRRVPSKVSVDPSARSDSFPLSLLPSPRESFAVMVDSDSYFSTIRFSMETMPPPRAESTSSWISDLLASATSVNSLAGVLLGDKPRFSAPLRAVRGAMNLPPFRGSFSVERPSPPSPLAPSLNRHLFHYLLMLGEKVTSEKTRKGC